MLVGRLKNISFKTNDMKDFIIEYYGRMREYLLKASFEDADIESIALEVKSLEEEYFDITGENMATTDSEFNEQKAVWGLFSKFDRLHGDDSFVERDTNSLLAIKLDMGFGIYAPPCPYSKDDFHDIQNKITTYISQRVRTPEDEVSTPLLTGVAHKQLSQEKMTYIINNLIRISHSLTDYVDYYDDGSWNWAIDCRFIVQYVFEKAAELTYKVAMGETTDGLGYDIRECLVYFLLSVPVTFQMKLDSVVDKLESIVFDITYFIEKNDYHLCDKETWFRPILFNIALDGMLYTLEQELYNN